MQMFNREKRKYYIHIMKCHTSVKINKHWIQTLLYVLSRTEKETHAVEGCSHGGFNIQKYNYRGQRESPECIL